MLMNMKKKKIHVCVTGGGTTGHITPALAVCQALRTLAQDQQFHLELSWIGSTQPWEKSLIESEGIHFYPIRSGKLRRYFSLRNIGDAFRVLAGYHDAKKVLKTIQPDIVFSKGGFVSVPPVIAAKRLKLPSLTHESDANPGLATRINARFVSLICLPYEEAAGVLKNAYPEKLRITGNPVRPELFEGTKEAGRSYWKITSQKPVILVWGGHQGAGQINEFIWQNLDELTAFSEIIHQTGETKFRELNYDGYHPVPFIHDELADTLALCDMVISRAGAGALSELTALRKPMILIPLGLHASRGDQILNARRLEQAGAAIVLDPETVTAQEFLCAVRSLAQDEQKRSELSLACASCAPIDSAYTIATTILELLEVSDGLGIHHRNGIH